MLPFFQPSMQIFPLLSPSLTKNVSPKSIETGMGDIVGEYYHTKNRTHSPDHIHEDALCTHSLTPRLTAARSRSPPTPPPSLPFDSSSCSSSHPASSSSPPNPPPRPPLHSISSPAAPLNPIFPPCSCSSCSPASKPLRRWPVYTPVCIAKACLHCYVPRGQC